MRIPAIPYILTLLQGKVSILAHSLGSVLCYDILCNQPQLWDQLDQNCHPPEHAQAMDVDSGGLKPLMLADLDAAEQPAEGVGSTRDSLTGGSQQPGGASLQSKVRVSCGAFKLLLA